MSTVTYYRLDTGLFEGGQTYSGTTPEKSAPPGFGWVEGWHDHLSKRVDLETGDVVDYQPPAPPPPTEAALAAAARAERDKRLAACDWTQMQDVTLSDALRAAWAGYRAALRAVPEQAGFPSAITWPDAPTAYPTP